MITLTDMLHTRTHRDLELMARAHDIPFTRRVPKADGLAALSQALHGGAYRKATATLESHGIEALQALVAGGGMLPLPLFTAHFGEVRRYRPWRWGRRAFLWWETDRHPWRYPVSTAERLYHLGLIMIHDGEMVEIIAEAAAALPPLPSAQPTATALTPFGGRDGRGLLLRDLAAFLGVLMRGNTRPVRGHWLPLKALREVNRALSWAEPELDDGTTRSEKRARRVRWLHYLLDAAGLVRLHAGILTPTPDAWRWLAAPPDYQWTALMLAVETDLESCTPRWHTYNLPEITPGTWRVLRHTLDGLAPDRAYRVRDILASLSPYLLPEDSYTLARLLSEPFRWSGVLIYGRGRVVVHPRHWATPVTVAPLQATPDGYRLPLPKNASPALTTLLTFAGLDGDWAIVDADAVRRAVAAGLGSAEIIRALSDLTPLPPDLPQRVAAWVAQAQRLTLRPTVTLYSPDADLVARIRDDWRLATYIVERPSPHHLTIDANRADHFRQRLERRGLPVTSFLPEAHPQDVTEALNSDMAAYLLLAVRVYQGLTERLGASVRIPAALRDWLARQVDNPAQAASDAAAIVAAVEQHAPPPDLPTPDGLDDLRTVREAVFRAWRTDEPLTVDYESPYVDGVSTRALTIHEVYEEGAHTYLDAYCHLMNADRTFRLDRILRVHRSPGQAAG